MILTKVFRIPRFFGKNRLACRRHDIGEGVDRLLSAKHHDFFKIVEVILECRQAFPFVLAQIKVKQPFDAGAVP
jgi:hypothetical protein